MKLFSVKAPSGGWRDWEGRFRGSDLLKALKDRSLRYRFKRRNWMAHVSVIHKIFDSKIRNRAPLQDFKVLALCVYRHKNAVILSRCVFEVVQRGWEVRLWALDHVHPDLEQFSCGAGAGSRCALLNSLITGKQPEEEEAALSRVLVTVG